MKTFLSTTGFLFVLTACLFAGDLNAPGAKPITVKSEMYRGMAAALDVSPTDGAIAFSHAIDKIGDANTQQSTDSHGFLLGLHYEAWRSLWRALSAGYYKGAEMKLAVVQAEIEYKVFQIQRKTLDLTPAQITECAGEYAGASDDLAWERADAAKSFLGTCPEMANARK